MTVVWNDSRKSRFPFYRFLRSIYYKIIVPNLPKSIGYKIYNYPLLKNELPYYAEPMSCLNIDIKKIPVKNTNILPTKIELFQFGHLQRRIESWAVSGMENRMEYVYPLLDKRIVEFAVRIPNHLYKKDGIFRYIYKLVMKDILPEEMRWKDFKAEPNSAKKTYQDVTAAIFDWKCAIIRENYSSCKDYIDLDKLCWLIECSQDSEFYQNNRHYKKGNTRIIDIVQGILTYSAIERLTNEK